MELIRKYVGGAVSLISRGVALILLLPVLFYRRLISPLTPPSCRFSPTCSAYAEEALRTLGAFRATPLIVWRVLRCQPFCRGGYDPVPLGTQDTTAATDRVDPHDPHDPHGD